MEARGKHRAAPTAASRHSRGGPEGGAAGDKSLLASSSAGTLGTARARGSGSRAERRAAERAGPGGAGGARGRNARAAPGAASPPPPRRPSAERPQPPPRGGPGRERLPATAFAPFSAERPPAALSLLAPPAASGPAAPPPAALPRAGAARRLLPPRSAVSSGRPACPPVPPVPYSGARCSGSAAAAILNFQTPSLPLGRRGAAAHAQPGRREGLGTAGWRPPEANPACGAGCEPPAPPSASGCAGGCGERAGAWRLRCC